MVISVNGKKHYLRLSQLPSGVSLDNLPRHRNNSAPRASSPGQQGRGPSPSGAKRSTSPPSTADMAPNSPGDETSQDGLRKNDPLGSLISLFPSANDNVPSTPGSSYKSNTADSSPSPALSSSEPLGAAVTSKVEPVNVNNLFESLNKFDWSMFGIGSSSSSGGGIPGLSDITPAPLIQPPPDLVQSPVTKTPKLKLPSAPIKEIVLQSHHQTLKERQESIIEQLYRADDLQCKSCGVRFSKEEMPQYTSHLDWHFRTKRREKDNAKRAQSRKWYFEKADWIVSDEIEDENADDTMEEEEKEAEEIVISTVAVSKGEEVGVCPVCREEFDQFYNQGGKAGEEEGWYLHNAMKHEGIIYHPECFKDKDNVVDTSLDSTMDKSTIEQETVVTKIEPLETMETDIKPVVENMETEAGGDANTCDTVKHEDDAPMEESTEPINVKKEPSIEQPTEEEPLEDASDVKQEAEVKTEDDVAEMVDTAEEKTESLSANTSLVSDDNLMLAAPVVTQPKVDIQIKINTAMKQPVARMDSTATTPGADTEDSEFDKDAIVTEKVSQEVLDQLKPRMKGKRFQQWPMKKADSDLSGLCSIM